MKKHIVKHKLTLIGILAGAVAGWCYWYFIGCASGTCAITSSPVNSTVYGAFMGGILLSMFKNTSEPTKTNDNEKLG
jgi:hypothetical protein